MDFNIKRMKVNKLVFITFAVIPFIFCGCHEKIDMNDLSNPTVRLRKADSIVKRAIVDNLNYPQSYDSISTEVDSAFSSIYTGETVTAAYNIIKAKIEIGNILPDYKSHKQSADFWKGKDKLFYKQAIEDMQEPAEKLKRLNDEIETNRAMIRGNILTLSGGEFVGWQIRHKFRCSDQYGASRICERLILANKDLNGWIFCVGLEEDNFFNLKLIGRIIEEAVKE